MNVMKRLCALTLALVLALGQLPLSALANTEEITPPSDPVVAHVCSFILQSTTDSTCTSAGSKSYACECGITKTESIPTIPHSYSVTSTTDATCTEPGSQTSACSVCGDKKTDTIGAKGHSYGSEVTIQPTCTEKGENTFTCSVCGDKYTEEIPAKGHTYTDKVTTPVTCSTAGVKTYTCSFGDHTYTEEIPADGTTHQWGEWTVTLAPKCVDAGSKSRSCTLCDAVETQTVDPTGHKHTSQVTTPPTCTEKGEETYTCTNTGCSDTYTKEIAATGHNHTSKVTTAPTCSATGVETYTCTNTGCSDTYTKEIAKDPTAHNWGAWAETTAPLCETKGEDTRVCTLCGEEEHRDVNPTNHSWDNGTITTEPTCTEKGVKTFACTRTGCTSTRTEEVAMIPHVGAPLVFNPMTNNHQEICTACSAVLDEKACSLENKWDAYSHWQECRTGTHANPKFRTTGKINEHPHTMDLVEKNCSKDVHHYACSVTDCGYTLEEKHTFETRGGKAPTCVATGLEEYKYCKVCKQNWFGDELVKTTAEVTIPATGKHTLKKVAKKDATCTEKGISVDYWHCSVCNGDFADAEAKTPSSHAITDIIPHDYTDKTKFITTASTHRKVCKVCNNTLPAEDHDFGSDVICDTCGYEHHHTPLLTPATVTCVAAGNRAYYSCKHSLCPLKDKYFEDENLSKELSSISAEKLTCTWQDIAKVPATCIKDGVMAHQYCPICKINIVNGQKVTDAALVLSKADAEHTWASEKWSYDGTHHWHACLLCDAKPAATGLEVHNENGENGKCTCGYDANHTCLDHLEEVAAVPATCTEDGTKAHYKCAECGNLFDLENRTGITDAPVDPKKGHSYTTKVLYATATKHMLGCDRCDYPDTVERDHDFDEKTLACICGVVHKHTAEHVATTATCIASGDPAYYHCTDAQCPLGMDAKFTDKALTNKLTATSQSELNHTLKKVAEKKATCKEDGMKEHYYCSTCKFYFTQNSRDVQYKVDAATLVISNAGIDHTWSNTWSYNAADHWKTCTVCDAKAETASHNATLGLDGRCDVCGYDPGHSCAEYGLDKTAGTAPTCTTAGTKDIYTCSYCGNKYMDKDAKTDYSPELAVDPAVGHKYDTTRYDFDTTHHWRFCATCGEAADSKETHTISNGVCSCGYSVAAHMISSPGTVTPGESASFTSSAAYSDFKHVMLDGKKLTSGYIVYSGSTVVTLTPALIGTLAPGWHTLEIVSSTGTASARFKVEAKAVQELYFKWDPVIKTTTSSRFVNPLVHKVGDGTITYRSSDPSVARVSPYSGKVTIVGTGACHIIATASETITHQATSTAFLLLVYPGNPTDNPKTGDTIGIYVAMMSFAAAGLWVVLSQRKRFLG